MQELASDATVTDLNLRYNHFGASGAAAIAEGATLEDALFGGDDYELLIASDEPLPGTYPIGVLTAESGLTLDSVPLAPKGFDHFGGER